MGSKRTIITISDQEKYWLVNYTKAQGISIAEAIRRGIACLKSAERSVSYQKKVDETRGIWLKGDGLKYQRQIRSEWES